VDNPPGFRDPVEIVRNGGTLPNSLLTLSMTAYPNRPRADFLLYHFDDITAASAREQAAYAPGANFQKTPFLEPTIIYESGQAVSLRMPPGSVAGICLYLTTAPVGQRGIQGVDKAGIEAGFGLPIHEVIRDRRSRTNTHLTAGIRMQHQGRLPVSLVINQNTTHALIEDPEYPDDPDIFTATQALPRFFQLVPEAVPSTTTERIVEVVEQLSPKAYR
jgi:hypothetical protein